MTDDKRKGMPPSESVLKLIGKTIKSVRCEGYEKYDDVPFLILTMTDGSEVELEGGYGGYSGESIDEYCQRLTISWVKE